MRARPLGEADRIVTLFSTESGKLDAVAKGVRRAKSHLAGRLEFGNECELQMHRGRSLDVIVHADIVNAPWQSLVEPERFAVAQLVAELIDAFCEPGLALPDVYALLSGMLSAIAASNTPRALVPRFSLRLLSALGIEPPVDACVRCGLAFEDEHAWVDGEAGGFICSRCRERWRDLIELDAADLRNLAELATPRGQRGAGLMARPHVAQAVDALIVHHLGRRPKAALQQ
ncbi:MAG: DNA repair protein RecO [Candidatus Eremiobacteraeota bacterium]|nr:DNA repair protein RecO [Candidatus Eremiobacteraeota bacterium]